jgi:hypothetical protein
MNQNTPRSVRLFVLRVTIAHTLTYFVAGLLAATILDYRSAFEQPIIRDYMQPFGSASVFWGPVGQLLRGVIIGLVLLPFRHVLADTRRGWLYLWLLLVGSGIVSTSAAAPASIEGVIYTRLPLWYHVFGLPEMLLQTLAFSIVVHLYLRHPTGLLQALPSVWGVIVQALVGACWAFVGYALASILFALAAGADIAADSNTSLRTQGVFVAPFALNAAITLGVKLAAVDRRPGRVGVFVLVLASNAGAIALYQVLVLGGVSVAYALLAPVLPAAIIAAVSVNHPAAKPRIAGARAR